MNITIIGVGQMGTAVATRLLEGGNHVTLVGRNPEKAEETCKQLRAGAADGAHVSTAAFGSATADEVVVLAVPAGADTEIVRKYGDKLKDKVLVDIATPFNATFDGLTTPPDSSAAEEVAKLAPSGARVVKAFTTNFSRTLLAGQVAGQPLDVFIAGDDAQAKETVGRLVRSGGMRPLDVGPLQRARTLEGLHLINATVQSQFAKPWTTAIKIIE
jgi:8-hydroxy-5-deazaflavin:NADPH oxidoreductase